ncbi:GHKL domain-containing protein, partial [Bacillus sp. S1-R1J2-FB]|uniref:GHKL domain-containing protein n=1 Tax=Bacillus sp. S1-R1J2-FB TaxID=1973494 RepID=UPI001121E821
SLFLISTVLVANVNEEEVCSEEKILQIEFFEMDSRQYFIVLNSSKGEAIDLQKIYEKNHSNTEGARGYGLFSLQRIINKTNNSTLETTYVSPYFTQTFILNEME